MRFWVLTGLIFGMIFTSTGYSQVKEESTQKIELSSNLSLPQPLSTNALVHEGLIFTLTPFKDGQLILITEKVACQDEGCESVSATSTTSEVIVPKVQENQIMSGGPITYKINDQLCLMVSETADKRGHLFILSYTKNKEERVDLVLEKAQLKASAPLAQL